VRARPNRDEYKASGYRTPPGVKAGAVLDSGSDEPRCRWAPFDLIAGNDYNLASSRYKPYVAEEVLDEDPAELIREVLADRTRGHGGAREAA
jgi:type I restriction enzyme M protein